MPILENSQHEKFAQFVSDGKTASEAWRQVTGKTKNADVHGSNWMVKDGIPERRATSELILLKAVASMTFHDISRRTGVEKS